MINSIKQIINNALYNVFSISSIKRKKVLFISHLGKSYSCNPKYLCEYLNKYHAHEFKLLWVYDRAIGKPKDLPKEVKAVPFFSRGYLYHILTAGTVVSNTRIPDWYCFKKRRGQKYIQTWHSSLRLKCIEGDANLPDSYVSAAKKDSLMIDAIISGCQFSTNIYKHAFWYNGTILETGTPRIDYLKGISQKDVNAIFTKVGLNKNQHYVLYAPTFRNTNDLSAYNIDYSRLIQSLVSKFGGVWKVLFRLHPNLQDRVSVGNLGDCCIDMTQYGDMQELLCVSDILITDYSSSMFDMAFLDKPCILYVSDLENYLANERNLYFDIKSLPFIVAQNNEQLYSGIMNYNKETYDSAISLFMEKIGSYEQGDACKKIAKVVFNV